MRTSSFRSSSASIELTNTRGRASVLPPSRESSSDTAGTSGLRRNRTAVPPSASLSKGGARMHEDAPEILLVEDDPDDVELTLHAFEKHGMTRRIHVSRDGQDALEFLF